MIFLKSAFFCRICRNSLESQYLCGLRVRRGATAKTPSARRKPSNHAVFIVRHAICRICRKNEVISMKKRQTNNILLPSKQVRSSLSIKIYADQLPALGTYLNYMNPTLSDGAPNPWHRPSIADEMKAYLRDMISKISPSEYGVHGIVHDTDNADGTASRDGITIWVSAVEKPHAHLLVIIPAGKHPRLSQIYKALGIVWREPKPDEVIDQIIPDDPTDPLYRSCIESNCTWVVEDGKTTIHYPDDTILMTHGGVEVCSSPSALAMYLTHDTDQAIKDQKHQYDVSEIISNDMTSYMALREKYAYENMPTDWDSIAKAFYDWGYDLKDIDELDTRFSIKIKAKHMYDVAKREYWKGVEHNIQDLPNVNRLCIFIQSPPGIGKTYFARNYLAKRQRTFVIDGGKTGKTDRLKVSDEALVINDQYVENLINLADGYKTTTYRRGSNNGFFCGDTLVILSNRVFPDYMNEEAHIPDENLAAIEDRFYICTITDSKKLVVIKPCTRGSMRDIEDRERRYMDFKDMLEFSLQEYVESGGDIDLLEYKNGIKEKYRREKELLESDNPEFLEFRKALMNEIPEVESFKDVTKIRPDYDEKIIFNNTRFSTRLTVEEAVSIAHHIRDIADRFYTGTAAPDDLPLA